MKVTILNQKYKVGCGKGVNYLDRVGILSDLNKIIDWDNSTFPKDKEGIENRKFLGDEPQLAPGNCFEFSGQVIAIDSEDRIVLVVSETGPLALERLLSETIQPELKVLKAVDILEVLPENINPQAIETDDYKSNYDSTVELDSSVFNLWKRHITKSDRYNSSTVEYIVEGSDVFIIPVKIVISGSDRRVFYNSDELDESTAELLAECIVNYERLN